MSLTARLGKSIDWKARLTPGVHFRAALVTYLALRVVLSVWAIIVLTQFPIPSNIDPALLLRAQEGVPVDTLFSNWILEPWLRWDANWYIDIAMYGLEQPASTGFAPLYPLVIRLLGNMLGGQYLLAASITSNICTLFVFWLLHRLVTWDHSQATANHVLLAVAFFPTTFFLLVPYTEALFFALVLGALLCGRHRYWAYAALLATMASITRWQGVGLAPALAWTYVDSVRNGRPWRDWRAWSRHPRRQWFKSLWLGMIPLGVAAIFIWYQTVNVGVPWNAYSVKWNNTLSWPWIGLLRTPLAWFGVYDFPAILFIPMISDWVLAMVFLALSIAALRRCKIDMLLFGWLILYSSIAFVHKGAILHSVSRYVLMVIPAFVVLGEIMRHRPRLLHLYMVIGLACSLLFSAFYVMWLWVA